jgi:hypothetical protein
MLKHRAIRLSIKDRIRDMFISPDSDSGFASFNVYYESQFRQAITGTFTPTFPFVYLLDSYLLPVAQRIDTMQPQVVIEIQRYQARPFELGNRNGRWITAYIHALGQNRGQRDDLGSFIMDYFGTALEIKSYSSGDTTGTVVDSAIVDDDRVVEDIYTPRIEIELAGGLLMGHTRVTLKFQPKA